MSNSDIEWQDAINALVAILENPFIENGYKQLKKYYEKTNRSLDAEAISFLMDKRFNATSSDISEKQRKNDTTNTYVD